MLKILGRATSTNVQKVLWFCDFQGIAYDHDNDIGGAFGRNDSPEYLAMNPNGRVPVVIDDGFVMWESCSIIRYLARKSKSDLYPSDFAARQIVERWMDWELSLLAPRHVPVFIGMVRTKAEDRNPDAIANGVTQWNAALQVLEDQLSETAFVAGSAFTLADIPIAPIVHRWFNLEIDRFDAPSIKRWYDSFADDAGFQKWVNIELA
ncbi:MAG: glutathione S-transferase [Alphaproteobacteria bacterium]|jgi:glutathione S-transferase|nr:glutathione S-transferase [Alphaproteobacteria bacterium]